MFRTFGWGSFLVVLLAWSSPSTAQDAVPTIGAKELEPQTDWYGVYLKDPKVGSKKMGYCRITRDKVEDGVRDSFSLVMKLVSFGQKAELKMTQSLVFETKAPYRMMRGEFEQTDGKVGVKISLVRAGDGFKVTHQAGGETKQKEHGPIDYTFLDATTSERWMRQNPKPGDMLTSKDFNMSELKLDPQTSTIKSVKSSLVGGVPVKYFEVETESPQLTMLSRYDSQGRMLSGKFAVFDILHETEAQAKNAEFSQDLFILGMVKVDRPLGQTRKVHELVLDVRGLEGASFPDGPRQRLISAEAKGAAVLKLGKKHGVQAKATAKEIDEGLQETLNYPFTHPKIKALADKAIGDAETPEEKVKRIVDFVHTYVEPNMTASLPNIHDLIQRKKGDCKSYALMFTTLARAAGVPSREVSGLLYMGDDSQAFGGHAWNEVVLGGVWVPIDASMGETEVDATHISFGNQDRAAKGLLETMGKLSFRLVEVRTR